jgi:hypothetical protein
MEVPPQQPPIPPHSSIPTYSTNPTYSTHFMYPANDKRPANLGQFLGSVYSTNPQHHIIAPPAAHVINPMYPINEVHSTDHVQTPVQPTNPIYSQPRLQLANPIQTTKYDPLHQVISQRKQTKPEQTNGFDTFDTKLMLPPEFLDKYDQLHTSIHKVNAKLDRYLLPSYS